MINERYKDSLPTMERLQIALNWLPRYTGMPIDSFGEYILLTNFRNYLANFAEKFKCDIYGEDKPMQAATNAGAEVSLSFSR